MIETRKTEFFVTVENYFGDVTAHKTNGIVFNYKGRLLGIGLWSDESKSVWAPIDIKTGMGIGLTTRNPLDKKSEESMDNLIECFNEFASNEQKRRAKIIKAAYDAEPDIKRQVFGE